MLRFHELKLEARTRIAEDAYALKFAVPEALRREFEFLPGQHLAVRAQVAGRTLRRTYSIVNAPGAQLTIGVRVQGQMSRYLAEELPLDATLSVMPPNGGFHPRLDPAAAKSYLAIAAGSGITPILSIATAVLSTEPASRFNLLYANRNWARCMFAEEVMALKNRYVARFNVNFLMSAEPSDVELFNGRLDAAKLAAFAQGWFDPASIDEYFLCGPGSMVEALSAALRGLKAAGRIHAEHFGKAPNAAGAAPEPAPAQAQAPPPAQASAAALTDIVIVMDGRRRSFRMPRDGFSILEAAERAGLELPFSCRAGVCSTCRAKIVSGTASMAFNQALEDWELAAGYVLCCQARPTSRRIELTYDEK